MSQAQIFTAESLGNKFFRNRFRLKYAYAAGAMYRGIGSPKIVVRMAKAGFIAFFGAGGLSLQAIENGIQCIQAELQNEEPYGLNFLAHFGNPEIERAMANLFLKYKVRNVEAAGFVKITSPLVLFRVKGLSRNADGRVHCANNVLAKISRPEVAKVFMSPPPDHLLQQLLNEGSITVEEFELAKTIPMSHDICVEADSGGHTDGGNPLVLLPAMLQMRKDISNRFQYVDPICVGLAGGIGTPQSVAGAFLMGADFVLTGSINQCTVDAGISDDVKHLLQQMNVQDTAYAPAGDNFEKGGKVQVLKKGVFFAARASKLFALYSHFNGLDEIPPEIQYQIQSTFFKKSFTDVWNETKDYLEKKGLLKEIKKANSDAKHKMALVFRWYFSYSFKLAKDGKGEDRVNYQIHTGPALGAFNQWVKGTELEPWTNRHAEVIGLKLLHEAADYLNSQITVMSSEKTMPK